MARFIPALGAFFVLAVALAACGGIPGNAVVRVDDETISKKDFDRWLNVAARSSQPPGAGGQISVPDAPEFRQCIASRRQTTPRPTRGQPRPTDAQLKSQCQQEYNGLRDQVLQFLISAAWVQGEAEDQDVKVSDADVKKEFEKQKKQSFPNEADYKRFLQTSGMSQEDINFRVRLDLLQNKIREKITKEEGRVTDKQIADYYNGNKQRFGQPERRDLQVVLTKSQARANQAKRALSDGQSFATVARRFSIDEASKTQGGKLAGLSKGQQEKALDDAVFAAPANQLMGPVKTQFGFYVFRVTKTTPATQQTLEQAKSSIRQLLTSQNQQKALQKFSTDFQKKWKDRTECRKGFMVAELCKNAPKPAQGQQTAPPGAVPQGGQGAPQQGAPQQGAPQQVPPQQGAPQQGAPQQGAPQQPGQP